MTIGRTEPAEEGGQIGEHGNTPVTDTKNGDKIEVVSGISLPPTDDQRSKDWTETVKPEKIVNSDYFLDKSDANNPDTERGPSNRSR